MILIDHHCHFTGALSHEFFLKNTLWDLKKSLHISDSGNWLENYRNMFEVYETRQKLFSDADSGMDEMYFLGAKDISYSYLKEGVTAFELRAGPKKSLEISKKRFNSMIDGFELIEKNFNQKLNSKLFITLIQNSEGEFVNVDPSTLEKHLDWLESDKRLRSRVVGFDFAGPEKNRNFNSIISYIKVLKDFRTYLKNRTDTYLEIAVHAGEFVDTDYQQKLEVLEKLIDLKVDRIGHGTLLWLEAETIDLKNHKFIRNAQNELLKKMAANRTMLEICPTSNFLLSPLSSYSKIPVNFLKKLGVQYTLNTDNKSILNTTLEKEHYLMN